MSEGRNTTIRDRHRKAIARGEPPCGICNEPIDYDLPHTDQWSYVVDHINPLSVSNDDSLTNKQAAHRKCNQDKSDRVHAGTDWMHIDAPTW